MKREIIVLSRYEILCSLEGLSLHNARIYREMQSMEEMLEDTHADAYIKKQIEIKKVDNVLRLMQTASVEKRFVAGFMHKNSVELSYDEIKIIEAGLSNIFQSSASLRKKLKSAKENLHKPENKDEMPLIYQSG